MSGKKEKLTVNRMFDYPNLSGDSITNINWSPDSRYLSYLFGGRNGDQVEIRAFDTKSGKRVTLFDLSALTGSAAADCLPGHALDGQAPVHEWHSRRIKTAGPMQYRWTTAGVSTPVTRRPRRAPARRPSG